VALVRQQPYQIVFLEDGSLRPAAPVAFTPIPVTAAERAAFRAERSAARVQASGGGQSYRAPPVSDAEFPETMPAFVFGSVIAADSMIWIGRSHRSTDKTWQYDVFDAAGSRAFAVVLPRHSRVTAVAAGNVYVARTDPADGLVYLERHTLR
jgi:hypothetical protein